MQSSFAAPLFLCGIGVASAAGGDVPAAQVFKSYEAAMNRHDADAVAAYWVLTGPEAQQRATIMQLARDWRASSK